MGRSANHDGFERIDSIVAWCRAEGLYLILDMHDAPGGQTGDNIDDSYGYPWLLVSERSQQLFCDIWRRIAERYKDETVILGYDLMNEPIAHYFEDKEMLNARLMPLYRRVAAVIREVDTNHILLLGGAQWNSNFQPITDTTFDRKIMLTCHRYGGGASKEAIGSFIAFRDSVNLPMYMGEIGHNTMEWQATFAQVMKDNNIGYTFWPYKKINESCFNAVVPPKDWQVIVDFAEADRSSYEAIRKCRPDQQEARRILVEYLEAVRFKICVKQEDYIRSLLLEDYD